MPLTARNHPSPTEATILARGLGNGSGQMPLPMARYLLNLRFSEMDKAHMHDLAVRNQNDELSPEERQELLAYAKAGMVISILKANARRTLGTKSKKRKRS